MTTPTIYRGIYCWVISYCAVHGVDVVDPLYYVIWRLHHPYLFHYILRVINTNLIPTMSIHTWEKKLGELINWSLKGKYFDLLTNSLNLFLEKCLEESLENLHVHIACGGLLTVIWNLWKWWSLKIVKVNRREFYKNVNLKNKSFRFRDSR